MDEMTLLRSVREDVAPPSESALNVGRTALLNPKVSRNAPPKRRRALRRAGWTGASVVGATAVVAALVATNVVGLAGWRGGAEPAAADTLKSAAVSAIKNSEPVVGPGQYLEITTTTVEYAGTQGRLYETKGSEALYVPVDESADWVWVRPNPVPYKTFGAASAAAAAKNYAETQKEFPNGDGTLRAKAGGFYGETASVTPASLAALPRDPYQLLNEIYRVTIGQGVGPDAEAFVYIADTLRSGIVPADLRAALYRAAAMIPGVTVTDKQATLDGRTGVAIGHVQGGGEVPEIIIDPDTGLLIGERTVSSKPYDELPAGTVLGSRAITIQVVNSAPSGGSVCGDTGTLTAKGCQGNG